MSEAILEAQSLQDDNTHLLMKTLLELQQDKWLDLKRIEDLRISFEINDLDDQIYFYRELLDIARRIPNRIFADNQARIKFIESLQTLLDKVIELEG